MQYFACYICYVIGFIMQVVGILRMEGMWKALFGYYLFKWMLGQLVDAK